MRAFCLAAAMLVSVTPVFGQQTLTVTETRSTSAQPDQAVLSITVTSDLSSSLDDVLALLSGTGVTAANINYVYSYPEQQGQTVQWTFSLGVPFSEVQATVAVLTGAQQKLAQSKSTTSIAFSGLGTQVSPQLQASQQCPTADMIADARVQAQKMVSGTGVTVGPILALSDGSEAGFGVPAGAERLGLAGVLTEPFFGVANFTVGPNCTVEVQFAAVPAQ